MTDSNDLLDHERKILDHWGRKMADNLIKHAAQHQVELRGLLDSGYNWFEWLADAFKDQGMTRDLVFWGVSPFFAQEMTDREQHPEQYERFRQMVAEHAIHFIGQTLYPPNHMQWLPLNPNLEAITYDPTLIYLERSYPQVLSYNGELLTVYFVSRFDCYTHQEGMPWVAMITAIVVEHLTEYDWLEWADLHGIRGIPYTMTDLVIDLVNEEHGVPVWGSGPIMSLERLIAITRERAEYIAVNFEYTMDQHSFSTKRPRIQDLRALGSEIVWRELPEFRSRFGGAGTGEAINRHSIRVYQYGARRYTLDRVTDANPPYFALYLQDKSEKLFTPIVPVEGQQIWGDGISWAKAEELAKKAAEGHVFKRYI